MKYKIIIVIVFLLILGWQLYKKYDKIKIDQIEFTSNYTPVEAIVKRVSPSGVRNKRSTILYVSYDIKNDNKTATIRRSGYSEGAYKVGDTITIYINPTNPEDIK